MSAPDNAVPVIQDLRELAAIVGDRTDLYVRWSRGPEADVRLRRSRDGLTGVRLPGLCANPLVVEAWWGDRPREDWMARRIHDYTHLREERGEGVRAWVVEGREVGRGPDNEPLIECDRFVARISDAAVAEAAAIVGEHGADPWGPLRRA